MRNEGCIAVPADLFKYLRVLSKTAALTTYLHLLKKHGQGVWFDESQNEVAGDLGKSRNTISEAFVMLTELDLMRTSTGKLVRSRNSYIIVGATCGECTITCHKSCSVSELAQNESKPDDGEFFTMSLLGDGTCSVSEQAGKGQSTIRKNLGLDRSKGRGSKERGDRRISLIFNHWLSKDVLTEHKYLSEKQEAEIQRALALLDTHLLPDVALEEVLHAIDNFAVCLGGAEYGWSHAWTLQDFMRRGLDRFVDEAKPLERELATGDYNNKAPARDSFEAERGSSSFEGL